MPSIIPSSDKTYIIAELSANHGGNLETALASVDAICRTGANAIKLQTFTPESMTMNLDADDFKANPSGPWAGRKMYDLYKETMLPWEWHKPIFERAKKNGIDCFSSVFDVKAVDFLDQFDPPAFKIASFEITDIPLIKYTAERKKPIIISTGIATMEDIELAISTCLQAQNDKIVILKCTSAYPTPPEEANLRGILTLKKMFDVEVGLSDHTMGHEAAIIAVSLGARVIEKHFILNRSIQSADSSFSLDEEEFKTMVEKVRLTEEMLGSHEFSLDRKTISRRSKSRSIYIVNDIKKGDSFSFENLKSIRSNKGLHPRFLSEVIGKKSNEDLKKGNPFQIQSVA